MGYAVFDQYWALIIQEGKATHSERQKFIKVITAGCSCHMPHRHPLPLPLPLPLFLLLLPASLSRLISSNFLIKLMTPRSNSSARAFAMNTGN